MLLGPHLLKDTVATLLEENGIFRSYNDAHHLKQVVAVCFVAINRYGREKDCGDTQFFLSITKLTYVKYSLACVVNSLSLETKYISVESPRHGFVSFDVCVYGCVHVRVCMGVRVHVCVRMCVCVCVCVRP